VAVSNKSYIGLIIENCIIENSLKIALPEGSSRGKIEN
jgi:hypothetical protein